MPKRVANGEAWQKGKPRHYKREANLQRACARARAAEDPSEKANLPNLFWC
jgi:hypothetical protein